MNEEAFFNPIRYFPPITHPPRTNNMNNFSTLISNRRSTRKFKPQLLTSEQVMTILQSALKAPSSQGKKAWQLVAIEDKEMLQKLSLSKEHGAEFIAESALAVVVLGDCMLSDAWMEDATIAAIFMQLQAEDLGLGSCWCQINKRETADQTDAADYVRQLLDIPYQLEVLSIIAFGHKGETKKPIADEDLAWEKVHIEQFTLRES